MSLGMQMPPHCGQQVVPSMQRIAAQGLKSTGWQIPEQSAPPVAGSQLSFGSSTHTNPSGHGKPASPPHMPPGVEIWANVRRCEASATMVPARPASTPRRERDLDSDFVHRSNRPLSIAIPPRSAAQPRRASHPVNAGDAGSVPGQVALLSFYRFSHTSSHLLRLYLCHAELACYTAVAVRSSKCPCRYRRYPAAGLGRGET
jgi:hypothetical protein